MWSEKTWFYWWCCAVFFNKLCQSLLLIFFKLLLIFFTLFVPWWLFFVLLLRWYSWSMTVITMRNLGSGRSPWRGMSNVPQHIVRMLVRPSFVLGSLHSLFLSSKHHSSRVQYLWHSAYLSIWFILQNAYFLFIMMFSFLSVIPASCY